LANPGQKLRIIVGGLVGQYPLGGVAWDYFHYLLGLHELGHDVYYYEDTWVWPFDPVLGHPTDDPTYTERFVADFFARYAPALSERWQYVLLHDKRLGMTAEAFKAVAQSADVFLNVSGACFIPDDLSPRCVKVFLDTDPGYNQLMLAHKFGWSEFVEPWCELVARHDRHLTYAENIRAPDCLIPRLQFDWRPTRCVVTLPQWSSVRDAPIPGDAPWSTVLSWSYFRGAVIHDGVEYFTKIPEFEKFQDLPWHVSTPLLLVMGGATAPTSILWRHGWLTLDAHDVTLTPQSYQRLVARSAGEWSVAKNIYVAMRSGWFSCRTACYLAAGRPAVVQETGWSKFIPSGRGLFTFSTIEEAAAGLNAVSADPAAHRAAAHEIAREYLAPDRVLPPMIDAIFDS